MTLKTLAAHLGLSPATISVVLNRSAVADSIPQETKARVFAAANELGYRPNFVARSLRNQRSHSIGVLMPEVSEGYAAGVMSGAEEKLRGAGYFSFVASHRERADLLTEYIDLLRDRLVEGYLLINAPLEASPALPTVCVAGHHRIEGVSNVAVDNGLGVRMALRHLAELGHRRIAFFKGHPGSADTEDRWQAIERSAPEMDIPVESELVLQLSGELGGPVFSLEDRYAEGHAFGRQLLERSRAPTALFAFNDISAIGAMRAFLDAGLRVPEDVSVVGFDDIQSAAFQNPSLTTVRQPLREMGRIAGQCLLDRLAGEPEGPAVVTVEPELIVRRSSGPAKA